MPVGELLEQHRTQLAHQGQCHVVGVGADWEPRFRGQALTTLGRVCARSGGDRGVVGQDGIVSNLCAAQMSCTRSRPQRAGRKGPVAIGPGLPTQAGGWLVASQSAGA